MQVFVTKTFERWMRKSGLSEERILLTALETFSGLSVVDLGAGLIKKRIAPAGREPDTRGGRGVNALLHPKKKSQL